MGRDRRHSSTFHERHLRRSLQAKHQTAAGQRSGMPAGGVAYRVGGCGTFLSRTPEPHAFHRCCGMGFQGGLGGPTLRLVDY